MQQTIRRSDAWTMRVGRLLAVAALGAGVALAPTTALADDRWDDPSPHVEGFVATSAGRLHYLDWGGTGETVVLLAGLGNTAHVFDDFAPRLARSFRVVGLTRRGFGASARPSSGYDTDTLARDLAESLDALGLERVHLVGHSVAGDEMTRFAGLHPDRVLSLVYLDAAYDRTAMRKALAMSLFTNPKPPSPPRPNGRNKVSVAAYSDYLAWVHGARWPEAEVRATGRFRSDGRYDGSTAGAQASARIVLGAKSPDYRAVQAPALALYATQDTIETAYPWLAGGPRGNDALLGAVAVLTRRSLPVPTLNAQNWLTGRWLPFAERERERFLAGAADATVAEIRSPHYLFLAHPDEVASRVRAFLLAAATASREEGSGSGSRSVCYRDAMTSAEALP
ncbi:MAG: alpha/beta fold hydrolase [Vicinamibacteria bacterium]